MTQLDQLKDQVETLWHQLVHAESETERVKLRAQYGRAYQTYKIQKLMVEEEPAAGPPSLAVQRRPMEPGCPSPFDYADYRDYLLAWMRFTKEKKGSSLADFARETGMAPEHVLKVLKRARRLELEAHRKVMAYMALPATEEAFLDALYHVSESESRQVWQSAMNRLTSFAAFRRTNPAEYEAWRYLSHWYYVAIREMSTLPGFQANAEWVQKHLRGAVPLPEIRKALEFLEKTGFFSRLPNGSVRALLKFVQCAGGVYRMSLRQFHREMLEKSAEAIGTVPFAERLLLGHTVALSAATRDETFKILNEAIEKIRELNAGDRADDVVYHVEVAAIPLTLIGT